MAQGNKRASEFAMAAGPVVEPGPRRGPSEPKIVGSNPTGPAILFCRNYSASQLPQYCTSFDLNVNRFKLRGLLNGTGTNMKRAKLSEKAIKLIDGKNFGNLAFVMSDGSPHVSPVWVDREGDLILVNTAEGRAKAK